jgi:hypothetical protein
MVTWYNVLQIPVYFPIVFNARRSVAIHDLWVLKFIVFSSSQYS